MYSCLPFPTSVSSTKSSLDPLDLVVGLANVDELWLERSTSNKETINVVGLGFMSAKIL